MGVTVISGMGGAGKTSLMTAIVKKLIRTEGQSRLMKSIAMIEKFNKDRQTHLTKPDKIPVYANYDMTFNVGYKEVLKPYFIDEQYFGLPNTEKIVAPVAPFSVIALQEMDDEYESRSRNLVKSVAGLYNKRRHFGLEIIMDLHRIMILDSIIREVTDKFIEIQRQEHEKNFAGRIVKTTWYCREFDDPKEMQRYAKSDGKEGYYKEVEYVNEGDIFQCYDTHSCAKEFIPKEGEDFMYLRQRSEIDVSTLPPEIARFYEKGAKKK